MHLIKAELNQIKNIVDMSVRAFGTDTEVGGKEGDYPPEYDSQEWHREMAVEGHLFQAVADGKSVGAAVLFLNEKDESLYIGRIFIDSIYHRKGYGILLMKCIEDYFPSVRKFCLDTPEWNIRTNAFYQKSGYKKVKAENGFIFYQKTK